jgi:hypothetical protein
MCICEGVSTKSMPCIADVPMATEEEDITLVVKRDDLTAAEHGRGRQHESQ